MAFAVQTKKIVQLEDEEWIPPQKAIGDRTFFSFSKWTATFVKMMTGKRLDLRKHKSQTSGTVDVAVMDEILQARQEAADSFLADALAVDEVGEEKPKKRKKSNTKVRAQTKHSHLVPTILDVEVRDRKLSILFEGISSGHIWMELLPGHLDWLKDAIQNDEPKSRRARTRQVRKPAKENTERVTGAAASDHLPAEEDSQTEDMI